MANKSIFFILFPSRDMLYLESKLDKLIENYSSEMFDLPQNLESLYREIQHLQKAVNDYLAILKLNKDEQEEFLNKLVSVALPDYSLTKIEYLKVFMLK
jgi:signal transduction histidine kinase